MELFHTIKRQRLVPDVIAYSALISACTKGPQPERALEPYDAMKQQGLMLDDSLTCSTLIVACEKGEQLDRAMELFDATMRQGLTPDVITFSALIGACAKGLTARASPRDIRGHEAARHNA